MAHVAPALLAVKSAVVLAWFLLLFTGERLRPAARPGGAWRWDGARLSRNGILWLINVIGSLLIVVPLTAWAARRGLPWRPAFWHGGPGLALDLVLLDFLIYWWHRATHRIPFLWRFHSVHHLDRFLDTSTAVRFHFGEVILAALARAAVVVALAFPLSSVLVFETLVLCATFFHHSNLRLPPRLEAALARVIITPSIHWVHHHAVQRDTDSNYGTVLSVWDPLFGSRNRWTRRTPEMAIGVERADELPLLALLLRPFRPVAARPGQR
ncbi:MAG TPA: sterol desaturase family protein [Alphaproteobacteria bacterium]|nr:sterol desaturase family protein [Alphaproteobacteria bacterium]